MGLIQMPIYRTGAKMTRKWFSLYVRTENVSSCGCKMGVFLEAVTNADFQQLGSSVFQHYQLVESANAKLENIPLQNNHCVTFYADIWNLVYELQYIVYSSKNYVNCNLTKILPFFTVFRFLSHHVTNVNLRFFVQVQVFLKVFSIRGHLYVNKL